MNNFSLAEKKKLLSLAKRLNAAHGRRQVLANKANNILNKSQISLREFAYPTTNASRNIVREYQRLEQLIQYANGHIGNVARKMIANYPTIANISHKNIIRNATESIRRHEKALRNIHSGRYQTQRR
jgi:hypothetical protein